MCSAVRGEQLLRVTDALTQERECTAHSFLWLSSYINASEVPVPTESSRLHWGVTCYWRRAVTLYLLGSLCGRKRSVCACLTFEVHLCLHTATSCRRCWCHWVHQWINSAVKRNVVFQHILKNSNEKYRQSLWWITTGKAFYCKVPGIRHLNWLFNGIKIPLAVGKKNHFGILPFWHSGASDGTNIPKQQRAAEEGKDPPIITMH